MWTPFLLGWNPWTQSASRDSFDSDHRLLSPISPPEFTATNLPNSGLYLVSGVEGRGGLVEVLDAPTSPPPQVVAMFILVYRSVGFLPSLPPLPSSCARPTSPEGGLDTDDGLVCQVDSLPLWDGCCGWIMIPAGFFPVYFPCLNFYHLDPKKIVRRVCLTHFESICSQWDVFRVWIGFDLRRGELFNTFWRKNPIDPGYWDIFWNRHLAAKILLIPTLTTHHQII